MEFSCTQRAFLQGITTVERAVSSDDSVPILTGILLTADSNKLHLVATDLELGVECFVPAQVSSAGTAVLEGKVLGQIARKLEGELVSYAADEAQMASLESGLARFNLHTLPADEFPTLPTVTASSFWRMRQRDMKRMIRQTIYAAATDESRPNLTGVFLEVEGDELRMVATDVSRLAFRRAKLLAPATETSTALIPARAMQELMRMLATDDNSTVDFVVADNQAVFRIDEVTLTSRLIEGQFPDYRRAFPAEQPTKLRLPRAALLSAVERAALIARRSIPPIITLTADGECLAISSREPDVGQVYEEVAALREGQPAEASYQAYFLTEALRAIDSDEVIMEMGEGLKQGSLRAVGDADYLYVLMPVRVG